MARVGQTSIQRVQEPHRFCAGEICFKFEGGQYDADKKPGTETLVQAHGAFALPGKSGCRGKVTLQDRTGVDVTLLPAAVLPEESYRSEPCSVT